MRLCLPVLAECENGWKCSRDCWSKGSWFSSSLSARAAIGDSKAATSDARRSASSVTLDFSDAVKRLLVELLKLEVSLPCLNHLSELLRGWRGVEASAEACCIEYIVEFWDYFDDFDSDCFVPTLDIQMSRNLTAYRVHWADTRCISSPMIHFHCHLVQTLDDDSRSRQRQQPMDFVDKTLDSLPAVREHSDAADVVILLLDVIEKLTWVEMLDETHSVGWPTSHGQDLDWVEHRLAGELQNSLYFHQLKCDEVYVKIMIKFISTCKTHCNHRLSTRWRVVDLNSCCSSTSWSCSPVLCCLWCCCCCCCSHSILRYYHLYLEE